MPLFEHYPAGRASMVTFVGTDHFLILEDDGLRQIRRLATAFFEAKLKGDQDAAVLLAEPWIEGVMARPAGLEPTTFRSAT